MLLLDAGSPVHALRFGPDGRLFSGTADEGGFGEEWGSEHIDIWTLGDGSRQWVPLPPRVLWLEPGQLAIHPTEPLARLAWPGNGITLDLQTGQTSAWDTTQYTSAVAVSPDGRRLLTCDGPTPDPHPLLTAWESDEPKHVLQVPAGSKLAGFLPDGDRFVTVEDKVVRVRRFADPDTVLASTRHPTHNVNQPQVSPDGRHLGVMAHGGLYVYDLTALGKPRKIGGSATFGDFRSFGFHPSGRTLTVVHGGPTQVKVYDVGSLTLTHKLGWKIGPLQSVAFSPDGTLGAAGSRTGKIVVWDVDG